METGKDSIKPIAFASEILDDDNERGLGKELEIRHNLSMDILVHKAQTKNNS